ncbi:MAG: hypothetical protein M5U29_01865 [Anaerolineae bacterium]|nr:hypothetical protein [Anaerolineae bacterium]
MTSGPLNLIPGLPLLPPDQVRIERVRAMPYPDRRRIRVEVEVTPFRERPSLEIAICNQAGEVVATASAIDLMAFRVVFTLHLRDGGEAGPGYGVVVLLYYDDPLAPQDRHQAPLSPPGSPAEPESGG